MTTNPLADEEELLRLVMEGLSQAKIAERKGVSRQAVSQRLDALRPVMEERGITVKSGRPTLSPYWVPWNLGRSRWRYHHITKMLRLLGRSIEGPALSEGEERRLRSFLSELDSMEKLPSGRGVVVYRGEDVGFRIIDRRPYDRGYVRWPDDIEDDRPLPPKLVMPDEGIDLKLYEDPQFAEIWAKTELPLEERLDWVLDMLKTHTRPGGSRRNAS
jgi:hypothetical protein